MKSLRASARLRGTIGSPNPLREIMNNLPGYYKNTLKQHIGKYMKTFYTLTIVKKNIMIK